MSSIKLNNYWLLFLALIIGIMLGIFIIVFSQSKAKDVYKQESHQNGYKFISPLTECLSLSATDKSNKNLKKKIQDKINEVVKKEGAISGIAIYYRDLNNGPWFGINENEEFTPASLLKVPLMMAYYKEAEINPSILNNKITINNQDESLVFDQNIIPKKTIKNGEIYTIEELIEIMVIYSDNAAANILLQHINSSFLKSIYQDLDLLVPSLEKTENFMSVKDYSSFFRVLYNASYLSREYSEKSLEILSRVVFKGGLTQKLPNNIKVSHKFGERNYNNLLQIHDCGIIYKKNNPYLLCVMTRGSDMRKIEEFIQDISILIYNN